MNCPVLVVDDDYDLRSSLRELLEDEGYPTLGASNGREALELLRAGSPPCLILLDLMMPVMDGWETLQHLSADPGLKPIPVAIMSANPSVQTRERAGDFDLFEVPFLAKPLKLPKLFSLVQERCSRHHQAEGK
jgi:CheY-like chemotaxis protein